MSVQIEINRGHTLAMVITSAASIVGSISMIIPLCTLSDLSKKPRYAVLNYCAIANLLYAAGTIPGNPNDGTGTCTFQAFVSNAFSISACFWVLVIMYIIFDILMRKGEYKIGLTTHFICWVIPTFLTLIPLVDVSYGVDGGDFGWCWLKPRENTSNLTVTLWYWFTYYVWVWVAILGSFIILFILYKDSFHKLENTQTIVRDVISKLQWYPLALTLAWGICTVNDTLISSLSTKAYNSIPNIDTIYYISDVMPCSQGFLFAVVFWCTMDDLRNKVYEETISSRHSEGHFSWRRKSAIRTKQHKVYVSNGNGNRISTVNVMSPASADSGRNPIGNIFTFNVLDFRQHFQGRIDEEKNELDQPIK